MVSQDIGQNYERVGDSLKQVISERDWIAAGQLALTGAAGIVLTDAISRFFLDILGFDTSAERMSFWGRVGDASFKAGSAMAIGLIGIKFGEPWSTIGVIVSIGGFVAAGVSAVGALLNLDVLDALTGGSEQAAPELKRPQTTQPTQSGSQNMPVRAQGHYDSDDDEEEDGWGSSVTYR